MLLQSLSMLELDKSASLEDIKRQYRLLSKKHHPDVNKDKDNTKFIEISTAYDWLTKNYVPILVSFPDDIETFERVSRFKKVGNIYELNVPLPFKEAVERVCVFIDEICEGVSKHNRLMVVIEKGVKLPTTLYLTEGEKEYKITFNRRIF